VAFKTLYHEDALADLEAIFEWSRENHAASTEEFANDLFNHLDFLAAFPAHRQWKRVIECVCCASDIDGVLMV
jgi:plasmid stabilization system protein ParE